MTTSGDTSQAETKFKQQNQKFGIRILKSKLIPKDVQMKVESIPNLRCKVKITMQPQWGRDMINPEIRELMGL